MARKRYVFNKVSSEIGAADYMPFLPVTLVNHNAEVEVLGPLDTGATVNVMPYRVGLQLGAVWEEQTTTLRLSGNLANWEARALVVTARIQGFDDIRLAFAWSQSDQIPVILGQVNFFIGFNVCFYRDQLAFDLEQV